MFSYAGKVCYVFSMLLRGNNIHFIRKGFHGFFFLKYTLVKKFPKIVELCHNLFLENFLQSIILPFLDV
jgi:hypothetical protein